MSPDYLAAGLLIGASLMTLGAVVIRCVSSARAEARQLDPRPCRGENVNICVGEGCYGEACRDLDFAAHTARALWLVEDLAPVVPLVPRQREAGEWS